jgi:hypothetical protein
MGTSSSYGGPGDTTPLLPSWALDPGTPSMSGDGSPEGAGPGEAPPAAPPQGTDAETSPSPATTPQPVAPVPVLTPHPRALARWRAAKARMGRVAAGGGQRTIRSAARAYVRAKGGARQAAHSAQTSQAAAVSFGGFLADAVRRGLAEALRQLGITQIVGQDAEAVFAAIIDAVTPPGADLEAAATRNGIVEALWVLYDQLAIQDGGWAKLESMDRTAVANALETAIIECVYSRWIQEVGIAFERKAASPQQAMRRERDVKDYIRRTVRLDFQNKDVLQINWRGNEGRTFVEAKFTETYSIFENL